jgi:hypothetical protein
MRPRERRESGEQDLFRARLDQIIDIEHALVRLARTIDWGFLEATFGAVYEDGAGRPPLPTRLMAGLAILKHTYNLSDEVTRSCATYAPWTGGRSHERRQALRRTRRLRRHTSGFCRRAGQDRRRGRGKSPDLRSPTTVRRNDGAPRRRPADRTDHLVKQIGHLLVTGKCGDVVPMWPEETRLH